MNILSAIGNTPLVELINIIRKPDVKVLCKLEGCNPGGSIKDRPALYMIEKAEQRGELTKGKIILEPTSGNTGIAIAMIGAAKGYQVDLCMPECVSMERRLILEGLGSQVFLTPAKSNIDGAIKKAHELLEKDSDKYFMPNQYDNEDNALAHYETTGPEIMAQTGGTVDYFVAGMGTTGTLMGTAKYLKEKKPSVKIVGVEPVQGHTIQGLKNMTESIVPKIYKPEILDEKVMVEDGEAFEATRLLAQKEGIFVGTSSGAAVAVAIQIAKRIDHGNIVVILPDRGDRYLSTMQFRSICAKCPP
ncbi:MAG TPA: cysteine synthase family protein [Syntrophorhabdaceae bacterium]|jgi:cysteine synthase B|nr:cysteine synthase family protein [Syntrophorhabdaceae bacterium]MDI9562379.1 cysteine synthase family protein [Pseudomonadota bacterium]MBV6504665.1 Cysteine synthase B [Syntrophorhabdaceae bacterium]HPH42730.1 cysteine synthase family protein [Syntrophorhabdaceae bacterium]HQG51873.1 cysteine synthase family protein [Syntrophorhabdaceae bacterium]